MPYASTSPLRLCGSARARAMACKGDCSPSTTVPGTPISEACTVDEAIKNLSETDTVLEDTANAEALVSKKIGALRAAIGRFEAPASSPAEAAGLAASDRVFIHQLQEASTSGGDFDLRSSLGQCQDK